MENDNKNKNKDGRIDEEYLMSMMAGGVRKDGITKTVPEPPTDANAGNPKRKKVKTNHSKMDEADYQELFFAHAESNARSGKSVYIRPEFHERLTRIVQVIGEDKISLYAYLDNVLQHHFNSFGEEIKKSYDDKYKPIL